jgi:hypothetical protein
MLKSAGGGEVEIFKPETVSNLCNEEEIKW